MESDRTSFRFIVSCVTLGKSKVQFSHLQMIMIGQSRAAHNRLSGDISGSFYSMCSLPFLLPDICDRTSSLVWSRRSFFLLFEVLLALSIEMESATSLGIPSSS